MMNIKQLKAKYQTVTQTERGGRIPALDGARALFVFLVAAFHIWQQSWLTPGMWVGQRYISMDPLLRCGYIWVDAMLLLSGFLLYLPFAESEYSGKKLPGIGSFYKRRLLRIVPSYYLCVLVVLLVVALPNGSYMKFGAMDTERLGKDLLAHATFTHTFFEFSYTGSPLNGALWTLAVEMQFYLLCPFIARMFRRYPCGTWLCMVLLAFCYRHWAAAQQNTALLINQLPAMLDVYANGFAAAAVYTALKHRLKEDKWTRILFTVLLIVAVMSLSSLVSDQSGEMNYDRIRLGQMERRFILSVLTAAALLGLTYGVRFIRFLFGNRLTRILSEISFQFYMWHQVLAVQLKAWGIPASVSDTPWMYGEHDWQVLYVLLSFGLAAVLSIVITYLFERPISSLGRKKTKH